MSFEVEFDPQKDIQSKMIGALTDQAQLMKFDPSAKSTAVAGSDFTLL